MIAKLLKPFEDKTGAKVVHTIVPWNVEGATYATNYAGPNPFDVSYQTSTDLTGLGTKGVLEVLNTQAVARLARRTASTKAKFIPNTITKSMYKGKLYGLPCIIGGTVIYYNKDLLAKAGVSEHPANRGRAPGRGRGRCRRSAAASGATTSRSRTRTSPGTSSTTASTTAASTSSRRTSRRSPSTSRRRRRRCSSTSDLVNKWKVQPPVGQYDREAGVSLFKAGRIGFLHDEPLRLSRLPQREAPVQVGLHQPGRRRREAHDLLDHRPLGHGLEGREQGRRVGAREVPLVARVRERVRRALRLGTGPAATSTRAKGDPQVTARQQLRAHGLGRAPDRPEDGAAHRRLRSGDRGGGHRQVSVKAALAKAQKDGPRSSRADRRDERTRAKGGCRRKRQRQPGTS